MRTFPETESDHSGERRPGINLSFRLLMLLGVLLVLILAWPLLQGRQMLLQGAAEPPGEGAAPPSDSLPVTGPGPATQTAPADPTLEPPTSTPTEALALQATSGLPELPPAQDPGSSQGVWVMALREGKDIHLFAYHPSTQPLVRLTSGPWQDITPAISPDGLQVAFSSNRAGQWDLYILDLVSGETSRVTESREYEAAPTWSPDGLWLAYEMYVHTDLEIYVRPVAGDQSEIRLTDRVGADFSPAWSPVGRQIAFVSDRTGENEIWVANLDQPGEGQFTNWSLDPLAEDSHPAWSPAGDKLAWTSNRDGLMQIKYQPVGPAPAESFWVGSGDWPAWGPDGDEILSRMPTPNQTYLVSYLVDPPGMVSAPASLSLGPVHGLTWSSQNLPDPLPPPLGEAASGSPSPLYRLALDSPGSVGERRGLVELDGIEAPYPQLHDLVDEAFMALRLAVGEQLGWDLLASLDNAFVPLTAPLPPGLGEDWLLTGRAFTFLTSPLDAGWMVAEKEDFGQETYWRVYVKTRFQDGSQGMPLHSRPWVFNSQNKAEINLYEQGGSPASTIPEGYWLDLTDIAAAYGWERLPALYSWRSYFLGTRLNELVLREGLDWRSAMLELYPPEALITPTVIIPPTRTPTPTVRWWRTPTPSATPLPPPTLTPSPSP